MSLEAREELGSLFDVKSRRAVCLGHLVMAAPHLVAVCIGSFIVGIGWFMSKLQLGRVVGVLLMIQGFALSAMILQLTSMSLYGPAIEKSTHEALLLIAIVFPIVVVTYGTLAALLINLGRRCKVAILKGAGASLALAMIMLFLIVTVLALAGEEPINIHEVSISLMIINFSIISLTVMNLIGNLLAGLGFLMSGKIYHKE
ncbi:MAG: hypothetical protein N3F04_01145 [Candidatus Nezhaarchaeota archaeon]|nr:hypothetical protein [Candidatus Nezhaarchaeota archaeon]MCX8141383.1 hypothetical protein [Candidatus Nezhaarchaeota archaeon]MDW8049649.1 hypothetical protein [Nitrososphaerota archaeon]